MAQSNEERNAKRRYIRRIRRHLFLINTRDEDDYLELLDNPYSAVELDDALKMIIEASDLYGDGDPQATFIWIAVRALYPGLPDWFYYYHAAR